MCPLTAEQTEAEAWGWLVEPGWALNQSPVCPGGPAPLGSFPRCSGATARKLARTRP